MLKISGKTQQHRSISGRATKTCQTVLEEVSEIKAEIIVSKYDWDNIEVAEKER